MGRHARPAVRLIPATLLVAALVSLFGGAPGADAMVKIDFEQKYFVHPEYEVWDFSVVKVDGLFHVFYHAIPEATPSVAEADTIWHATSTDLSHWTVEGAALTVGPSSIDAEAMWAPDVFWDDGAAQWVMAYTGVNDIMVQRPCLAYSQDLYFWAKGHDNPLFEPDSETYRWNENVPWSACRDPYVYKTNRWCMLSTVSLRDPENPGEHMGALHLAHSVNLVDWIALDPFFVNDGPFPEHVLESCQYHVRDGWHHLFFYEQDIQGVSHVFAANAGDLSMASRTIIDWGIAPEIDRFEGEIDLFSRLAPEFQPPTGNYAYVVRFDTLDFDQPDAAPVVLRPHPLDRDWAFRDGFATLGNPCYGDNPVMRGEQSCGLVGHGWYGSREYYQGPLSGVGTPGSYYGDGVTGTVSSFPFTIEGNRMKMLVGGGNYPETLYIALMDAEADTMLLSETGHDEETMNWREWDLTEFVGLEVYLTIVDEETGAFGHINVDEIEEFYIDPTAVGAVPTAGLLADHRASPNPFNPTTTIRFTLVRAADYQISIHDLQGRTVWSLPPRSGRSGQNRVHWHGVTSDGKTAPAGTYVYRIQVDGAVAGTGKLALVK